MPDSPSSSTTNQPADQFIIGVSQQTGIDPRVILAWMDLEGAFTDKGTGGYNFLNIKHYTGDRAVAVSPNGFAEYASVQDAINATVTLLHSPQYANILRTATVKPPPRQQIAAIAASPWDQNHYGGNGGQNLLNKFNELFKNAGASAYQNPVNAPAMLAEIGTSSDIGIFGDVKAALNEMNKIKGPSGADILDWINKHKGPSGIDVAKDVWDAASAVPNAINWVRGNWDRIFIVIGGFVGLTIAVVLLYKSQSGEKTFTFSRGD